MVKPIPVYEEHLSGDFRVRRGWFGRPILQCQIERIGYYPIPPRRAITDAWLFWRDATWSDFQKPVLLTTPPTP